jgi:CheY-like chemotaxis protein/HPt (histidine-containing phosphotransfer) domain-containing protein
MHTNNEARVSRVLIADDDPVIRRWLGSILENDGYVVVSMDDGRNAFRTLQSDAEFAGGVFDMSMPYLQGSDLIRYMRTEKRLMKIPVMMITAETDIETLATCFNAGATVVLPKPFTRHRLQQSLRMMLKSNSAPRKPMRPSSLPTSTREGLTAAPETVTGASPVVDRDEHQASVMDSVVDLSIINELDEYRESGEPSLAVELIDLYLENTARQISEISAAIKDTHQRGLRQAAHALKGSSLTMGARRLGDICELLERERIGSTVVSELLSKMEREFAATSKIFTEERQKRMVPVAA